MQRNVSVFVCFGTSLYGAVLGAVLCHLKSIICFDIIRLISQESFSVRYIVTKNSILGNHVISALELTFFSKSRFFCLFVCLFFKFF